MPLIRATLKPMGFFHTPIRGDTLFGQLCWALRYRAGEARLKELLSGYCEGQPWLAVSDAFPAGHLPRPQAPAAWLGFSTDDPSGRKAARGKVWMPLAESHRPLYEWSEFLRSDDALVEGQQSWQVQRSRMHNSLNRLTMSTGAGAGFAPYQRTETWWHRQAALNIYLWHDERTDAQELAELLADVGHFGYGKEASSGAGKYSLKEVEPVTDWPRFSGETPRAPCGVTLAPCAPQKASCQPEHSFYRTFVRFGRHGDQAVHAGVPFKNPVLMADTGALLSPVQSLRADFPLLGQGLGGVSRVLPETVQQGYAIVYPVTCSRQQEG